MRILDAILPTAKAWSDGMLALETHDNIAEPEYRDNEATWLAHSSKAMELDDAAMALALVHLTALRTALPEEH